MRARAVRLAAGVILLVLCALQGLALLRSPPAYLPVQIDILLAPGAATVLGSDALALPTASGAGLRLRRDLDGRWWAASAGGVLRVERGAVQTRSSTLVLERGARFQLGALHYLVEAADGHGVQFSDGRQAWRYDGASVWRDGARLPACPGAGPGTRLAAAWNRWLPAGVAVARPLSFGGNLSCGNQVGNPHAAPASAVLRIADGAPLLTAAAGAGRTPLLVTHGDPPYELALAEQALDGVGAIGIGRTRMTTRVHGGALQLHPVSRVALATAPHVELPDGVRWHWERRDPWAWPAPATPFLLAALAAGALSSLSFALAARMRARGNLARAALGATGIALAAAGLAMLVAQRMGASPGVGWSLLLCWAALWYGLAWRGAGAVIATGVLLLAAGLLLQLELGLGAPDTSWLRHFQKTAAACALGMGCAGAYAARRPGPGPGHLPMRQAGAESLLLLLAAIALTALLVQVGWGNETGVFDLQPVEFAKLALTVLAAHCIALGVGTGIGHAGGASPAGALLRGLRLAAPALLFVALLGVALVQVDDYSPLLLLLVWGAAMLLAWACAARRPGAALAVAALACTCLGLLAVLRGAGPEASGWSFYGERFGVWLDPAAHPHTGQQLLLGAAAIAGGGWFGADGVFGLAALGQGAFEALAIPAVQDDFAPSFLLQRHGLGAGLALWALQAAFLCALLQAALRAWQGAVLARDFRHAWAGRFRCFVLCGGAAFLFGHFLLSWGTNLAFFPVMGQPMSFLSAGGSHLLFFIFPLLAFASGPVASAGAPIIEEN